MTSRKIKTTEKTDIRQPRHELLQVADIVAREKGISLEEALFAMESAIQKSVRAKYGANHNIRASIDRSTGEIRVWRVITVVETVENEDAEISLEEARAAYDNAELGGEFTEELPPFQSRRSGAQLARQVIISEIRRAEREHQYTEFIDRKGQIVNGIVKQVDFSQVIVEIGRTEGVLYKDNNIPRQKFKIGDRVKALLLDVKPEASGPMLILSRTHSDFLKRLFEQEVTEVYDGVVQIMGIARDPGSRAKMSVYAADQRIDPVGACVGVRGTRVQNITNELRGEKIDVIPWSSDPATYIISALSLQEVKRVIIDEESGKVDVIIDEKDLSQAIGRRGQNVRLASKLTGWKISVISEAVALEKHAEQKARAVNALMEGLEIDEIMARLLVSVGLMSVEDVAQAEPETFSSIKEVNEETLKNLQDKAIEVIEEQEQKFFEQCENLGIKDDLLTLEGFDIPMLTKLIDSGIRCKEDLAELSNEELVEIVGTDSLSLKSAGNIIMEARKAWFNIEEKDADQTHNSQPDEYNH